MATPCRGRAMQNRIRAWKRKAQRPRLNGRQSTIIVIKVLPGIRPARRAYPILNGLVLRGLIPKSPLFREMLLLAKPLGLPKNPPGSDARTGVGRTPRCVLCSLVAVWKPSLPLQAIAHQPWRARSRLPAPVRHHMVAAAMAMADIPMVGRAITHITHNIRGIIPAMDLPTTIPPISTRRLISALIIADC